MTATIRAMTAAVIFFAGLATGAPALATDGRNAIGMCINQPGCSWAMGKDGKDIDIVSADGTYIHCADVKSECTIPLVAHPSRKLDLVRVAPGALIAG